LLLRQPLSIKKSYAGAIHKVIFFNGLKHGFPDEVRFRESQKPGNSVVTRL